MDEIQDLTQTTGADEVQGAENSEVPNPPVEQSHSAEVNILELLGIPTERKPEFFEPEQKINEHLPDFDPPKPSKPPIIELPDLTGKKTAPKNIVDAGTESAASMAIEAVDVVVPLAIDHFIAKEGTPERYCCSNTDQKEKAKKAMAKYMGTANIEISPMWEMVFTISLMYVEPVMNALETAKLKRENKEQKKQLEERDKQIDDAEKQRIEDKKQRIELEKQLNEKDLENAQLAKQAATAKIQAKRLQKELDNPEKHIKPKKVAARKKAVKSKKPNDKE
jgi:hypothetical protein